MHQICWLNLKNVYGWATERRPARMTQLVRELSTRANKQQQNIGRQTEANRRKHFALEELDRTLTRFTEYIRGISVIAQAILSNSDCCCC